MGGISSFADAMEFLLVGASAVQIGTMNFVDPDIGETVADAIEEYFAAPENPTIGEYVGSLIVG